MTTRRKFLKQLGVITALGSLFPRRLLAMFMPQPQLVPAPVSLGSAGDPVKLTKEEMLDIIFECGRILDEQRVPEENRWIQIPEWYAEGLTCT